jgi:hypothetical protein
MSPAKATRRHRGNGAEAARGQPLSGLISPQGGMRRYILNLTALRHNHLTDALARSDVRRAARNTGTFCCFWSKRSIARESLVIPQWLRGLNLGLGRIRTQFAVQSRCNER